MSSTSIPVLDYINSVSDRNKEIIRSGVYNPSRNGPAMSYSSLIHKANYLVVYDVKYLPDTPFHYYPLRAVLSSNSTRARLTTFPGIIAPGIVMLKSRKYFRVGVDTLVRGILPKSCLIEDPLSFFRDINNELSVNPDVPDGASPDDNQAGPAADTAGVDEIVDIPAFAEEFNVQREEDPENFKIF